MGSISKTIHDYLRTHTEDNITNESNLACPFSLRRTPKEVGDFDMSNDFSIVPVKLRFIENFKDGIPAISRDMDAMKKSIEPIAMVYVVKLLMFLPNMLRHLIMEDYAAKHTFGFSNVPGPKRQWVTAGARCQSIGFFMPVGWSLVGSFSIISHADVVKMGIGFDKACMSDPQDFINLLMKNLDELLGGAEWRNYGKERGIK